MPHKSTVLICDDSMLIRKKLKGVLDTVERLEVIEANNGEEAVAICRDTPPALVFMDIVMPEMNGLDALQNIKALRPETVVVMASSAGTENNLRKALALGADDFIQKPIAGNEVLRMIDKYVKPEA